MTEPLDLLLKRHPVLTPCAADIGRAFEALTACFAAGGKLLVCGNGGSAADAEHLAGELLKRFEQPRPLPAASAERMGTELATRLEGALPAIPLSSFTAFATAFQNDRDGAYAFAQLTYALGRPGDALLCISTSGDSPNVLHAADVARAREMTSIGLTGASGGRLRDRVDICICVPEHEVAAIQELHLPVYHTLCRMLEQQFFGQPTIAPGVPADTETGAA